MELNKYIDSTLISPTASINDYYKLAEDAVKHKFRAIVVPTFILSYISTILKGTNVLTAAVVDFPLGLADTYTRFKDIEYAKNHHVQEIDLVINPTFINGERFGSIEDELCSIYEEFHISIKAIVDFGLVKEKEVLYNSIKQISSMPGVGCIKTGTGWFYKVLKDLDVWLYKKNSNKPIKAAGGIKSLERTKCLIEAGASIIGTSSAVEIINEISRSD
jgi:deoxyribose-phosphate aldolase